MISKKRKFVGASPRSGFAKPPASGGGGATPPTLPTLTPNLLHWMDAADSSTITTVGGNVSLWEDKGSLGLDYQQTSASLRPAYNSSAQNGWGGVSFNGSSQYLISPTETAVCPNGAYTFIIVMDIKDTITAYHNFLQLGRYRGAGTRSLYNALNESDTNVRYLYQSSIDGRSWKDNTVLSSSPTGELRILYQYNGGGVASLGNYDHFINGVEGTESTSGYGNFGPDNGYSVMGASYNAGGPTNYCEVEIYELLVYDAELSASDKTTIYDYINDKWGI